MSVTVRQKGHRLYLDIYKSGQRRWESLGLSLGKDAMMNKETLLIADIARQKRELQLAAGEWSILDPLESKRPVVDYCERLGEGPKDHLTKSLKYLRDYFGQTALGAVSTTAVMGYQKHLLRCGLAKASVSKYFGSLRKALGRAVQDRILLRNPADGIKNVSIPENVIVYISPDELGRLANTDIGGTLGADVKRAFLFACFTGLRISDLRSLTWGDIERDPLRIAKRQKKTGRVVSIPLHESAWAIVDDKALHHRDEAVFPVLAGTGTNTNRYLEKWSRHSGIDKLVTWHTARRTFATLSLQGGADILTIAKLLGHTGTATAAKYAAPSDTLKRRAVDGLPAIEIKERMG